MMSQEIDIPAVAQGDSEPGSLEWLGNCIAVVMEDFDEVVAELEAARAADSATFPFSVDGIRSLISSLAEDPGKVLDPKAIFAQIRALNLFCVNNRRKIASCEAVAKLRARLKTAGMRASCCLVRGGIEELIDLRPDFDAELGLLKSALVEDAIRQVSFELTSFLAFIGTRGSESVTRFQSPELVRYRQLFRAQGSANPCGRRVLFVLSQIRDAARFGVEAVKRQPNPEAFGFGKGFKGRRSNKAIPNA